ncbi:MAG: zf-HC2 domain-containing protein [Actinomycetota bacterium]
MDCRRVQAAISERMDGEHLSRRAADAVEGHLPGCAECSAFERNAWRIRESSRFGVAENVPDLVEPIMAAVRSEAASSGAGVVTLEKPRAAGAPSPRERWDRPRSLAPLVAAALVGAIVGSVVAGGLLSSRPTPLAAADVVRGVDAAANDVQNYSATFAVTEYHFSPVVPVRNFTVHVWFSAPERIRLDVSDQTAYPSARFTPNNLSLVANGSRWSSSGPGSCGSSAGSAPSAPSAPAGCAVRNRPPFSSSTPLPTDMIVPVSTLGQTEGLSALERGRISGRPAVRVELSYARAAPLFPYLGMGGTWRPYFPDDRVVLWLDARTYLPLRTAIYPSADPARRAWERDHRLPVESPTEPLLESSMITFDRGHPPAGTFKVRGLQASSEGAQALRLANVQADAGFAPVLPADRGGLGLYRVVGMSGADAGSVLVTYAGGLSYLKVQESATWNGPTPYGGVAAESQRIALPQDGVGLYAPATPVLGRRISLHTDGLDVYLETNLPRKELVHVAGSLPLHGLPLPESWTAIGEPERVALDRIPDAVPFRPLLPARLPAGYDAASAQVEPAGASTGFTVFYQQRSSDLAGATVRIHEEPGTLLPPASSAHQSIVEVRGEHGRFTPDRSELEWVENGVYVAIDGSGLRLRELLSIASALR